MLEDEITQIPQNEGDEISLIDLAAVLWRRRWLIVVITAATAVGSVFYALSQPNIYAATSTMLPISGSSSSMLAQYAGLASLAGVSLPNSSTSSSTVQLMAIMNSRGFAEKVAKQMNLGQRLIDYSKRNKAEIPIEKAIEMFQKGIFSISLDTKTSLLKVTAKTKDPTLSRDIANVAVSLIQDELKARVLSSSGKNIILLEEQLAEQEKRVRAAQEKMMAYQRRNKLVSPQAQNSGGLQLYQSLIQQKITAELQISQLENTLADNNPRLTTAKSQLEAIKNQIENYEKTGSGIGLSVNQAPMAMMEYTNLAAELEMVTKIYGNLLSSLENVKLQEASDKTFIEVIDLAITPERKSEPARAMICIVGTIAGGFFSMLLAFILEVLSKLVADPEVRAKFSKGGTKKASVR